MSHRSLFWPISLIVVTIATLALMFLYAPTGFQTGGVIAANVCATEATGYDACYRTATAAAVIIPTPTFDPKKTLTNCPTLGPQNDPPYPPYADCLKTRTAILLQTERAGTPTAPAPNTSGSQGTNPATPTPTPTFTSTPTATSTSVASDTPQPISAFLPTSTADTTPTPTIITNELATGLAVIPCLPGDVIPVDGRVGSDVALIVSFGGRPVGGGFSRNDGLYSIRLSIGDERPGIYRVQVQERGTRNVIDQFDCQVPASTPTPTPSTVPQTAVL